MTATSRDQILARIRAATGGAAGAPAGGAAVGGPADEETDAAYAALPRDYLRAHHDPASHDIAALFAERRPKSALAGLVVTLAVTFGAGLLVGMAMR